MIKPPPESNKVFSMAKFMSSWILFDVAVLEDLWLALSLLVSLWKLNLPACRKFDYATGKILLLLLPMSRCDVFCIQVQDPEAFIRPAGLNKITVVKRK